MQILIRDDTRHGEQYVLLADAEAAVEAAVAAERERWQAKIEAADRAMQEAGAALVGCTKQAENASRYEWLPIETAPTEGREMFVVRAFSVRNGFTGGSEYTTDPWCVWRQGDGSFARWPHHFEPTHWMPLPPPPQAPNIANNPAG